MTSKGVKFKDASGNAVYPCPYYPVGSIYLSVNNIDPSEFFGGTWEQIKSDAYLKIVNSNAGQLGGTSSNHKIPVSSIPSHNHCIRVAVTNGGNAGNYRSAFATNSPWWGNDNNYDANNKTNNVGGGQAYYPYYLGVYVWKRTA